MISGTWQQCADSVLCEDISSPHSEIHGHFLLLAVSLKLVALQGSNSQLLFFFFFS